MLQESPIRVVEYTEEGFALFYDGNGSFIMTKDGGDVQDIREISQTDLRNKQGASTFTNAESFRMKIPKLLQPVSSVAQ